MMTDPTPSQAYAQRIHAVLAYIESNLDGDLSLERLSGIAAFSKFHFHRQFAAFVGVPVARYVQFIRLRQAARTLANQRKRSVLDVALDAGFDSPEAFARAFRRSYGMSPTAFRRRPNWAVWGAASIPPHLSRTITMTIKIVQFTTVPVAALTHRGSPGMLSQTVGQFVEWRKNAVESPIATTRSFGIPRSNPDTTPGEDWTFDLCSEALSEVRPNTYGVHAATIPGGRCAVLRHQGSTDHINETIYPFYRDWLPQSGERLAEHPLFFHYLSVYPETPLDQWETDIYIPLA
jgi:AraC family transcriptional regulator